MKKIYTGIGFAIWKAGALVGIPYAKHKLEERG
jgi:hypothetical protein